MATTTNLGLTKYGANQVKANVRALPVNLDTLDALFPGGVAEVIRDTVYAALTNGIGIAKSQDDGANTITLAVSIPNHEETIHFFLAGEVATGTLKDAAIVGLAGTIVDVRARILTAPVGAAFNIDVNKNGVTLFTTQGNRPIIADGANASSTTLPDVVALVAGDYLSIDIDQVGSGTAGSNLMVSVTIKRANVA